MFTIYYENAIKIIIFAFNKCKFFLYIDIKTDNPVTNLLFAE